MQMYLFFHKCLMYFANSQKTLWKEYVIFYEDKISHFLVCHQTHLEHYEFTRSYFVARACPQGAFNFSKNINKCFDQFKKAITLRPNIFGFPRFCSSLQDLIGLV